MKRAAEVPPWLSLDDSSGVSLYRQLYEGVRRAILSGPEHGHQNALGALYKVHAARSAVDLVSIPLDLRVPRDVRRRIGIPPTAVALKRRTEREPCRIASV